MKIKFSALLLIVVSGSLYGSQATFVSTFTNGAGSIFYLQRRDAKTILQVEQRPNADSTLTYHACWLFEQNNENETEAVQIVALQKQFHKLAALYQQQEKAKKEYAEKKSST